MSLLSLSGVTRSVELPDESPLEILKGVDVQPLVNLPNPRRSKARDPEHLQQSFGRLFLQLFKKRRSVGLRQIMQDRQRRRGKRPPLYRTLADAVVQRLAQRAIARHRRRPGRKLHCANGEPILTMQFEERCDLCQGVRCASTIHTTNILANAPSMPRRSHEGEKTRYPSMPDTCRACFTNSTNCCSVSCISCAAASRSSSPLRMLTET